MRGARRVFPVTHGLPNGPHFFARGGRRVATPLLLCFIATASPPIRFAVDSDPGGLRDHRDSFAIWTANAFALMGLRALFALVEALISRFRYLDETIAVVLRWSG